MSEEIFIDSEFTADDALVSISRAIRSSDLIFSCSSNSLEKLEYVFTMAGVRGASVLLQGNLKAKEKGSRLTGHLSVSVSTIFWFVLLIILAMFFTLADPFIFSRAESSKRFFWGNHGLVILIGYLLLALHTFLRCSRTKKKVMGVLKYALVGNA